MSIKDEYRLKIVTFLLGVIAFSGILLSLFWNSPEFKNLIYGIEDSDIFWQSLAYLIFFLSVVLIVRSLFFLFRFSMLKFKGEKFVGKITSLVFTKSIWPPDGWVGYRRPKPTASIEFIDGSGNLIRFQQIVDNRLKVNQPIFVLYDKNAGFKSLDDYLLVATNLWSLAWAGLLFWLLIFTGVLW